MAEGLTNREIAERLHITERSAESHLERIRLRLGFRSRAQVAAWFVASRVRKCGSSTAAPPSARATGASTDASRRSHLPVSALGWVGFDVVTLWAVAFLAGVFLPRTVDAPPRVAARPGRRRRPGPPAPVRRPALGDGAALGEGVAAAAGSPRRSSGRRTCWPPTSAWRCSSCCGSRSAGRVWHVGGARRRGPVGTLRGRLGAGPRLDVRRRPTSSWSGCARRGGGGPPQPVAGLRDRRPVRGRPAPADDGAAAGLLGDAVDGRLAPAVRGSPPPGYVAVGIAFEERDLRRTFGSGVRRVRRAGPVGGARAAACGVADGVGQEA